MSKLVLEPEEREILEAFERGELQSIPDKDAELKKHQAYAASTFKPDKRVNIRLSHRDFTALPKQALADHAMEEMAEDGLDIEDVERAILKRHIARIDRDDPRGTKYVVEGTGVDGITPVGVVGRFTGTERYLIITVYEITALED